MCLIDVQKSHAARYIIINAYLTVYLSTSPLILVIHCSLEQYLVKEHMIHLLQIYNLIR
jgi:hypothetical protein